MTKVAGTVVDKGNGKSISTEEDNDRFLERELAEVRARVRSE